MRKALVSYVAALRPSDQLILGILGCFVVATSIASLVALDRRVLVTQPAYGGTVTEGEVGSPRFVNPILAISDTDQDLATLTYAGLMGTGSDGTLVPVLAKSYIVSPDGKTYQFTLRDNAKFSDGTSVTADDVVYTVQKAQDAALKSPQYANWAGVTVTALDAKTVQFTLAAPYAPFLENTTLGILPAHIWRNVSDAEFPFSNYMIQPVGAGPFVVSRVTRANDGTITGFDLKANKNYILGRPYLDAFHFVFFDDRTSLQTAMTQGKIESGYAVLGKRVLKAPYARVFAVFFNPAEGAAFTQKAVRQALSTAINREAIVQNLFGGYAMPAYGPVPPSSNISQPTSITNVDRINAATKTLQNAGWSYASTTGEWKDKSGDSLSLTLKTSNIPELKSIAQAVQTDWEALHVPTSLQLYEPGDLAENVIQPRAYQTMLFGMVIGKSEDLYDFWDSSAKTAPGLNVTGYSNPTVDKLLTDLRATNDPTKHDSDLNQINQLIAADAPAAFIESPDFVYTVPKDLEGVILPQIASPKDRFATVATWYRRTESVLPFLARSK